MIEAEGRHVAFNSLATTGLGLTLAIFVVRLPEELMRALSRNGAILVANK